MTLSRKNATDRAWVLALQYADANGFTIIECLPYGPVHRVHSEDSWHYYNFIYAGNKKRYSRGADINWPGGGEKERDRLDTLVKPFSAFGVAVIYDMTGKHDGPTKTHYTHLHGDQGSYANLGSGKVAVKPTDLTVYDTQVILHMAVKSRDNLNDATVMNRLRLVREASAKGGNDYPSGIKVTQQIIGAKQTGRVDAQTRAAHDATVRRLKTLWKKAGLFTGVVNNTWDTALDEAVTRFNKKY